MKLQEGEVENQDERNHESLDDSSINIKPSTKFTSDPLKPVKFTDKAVNCPKFNKTRLTFNPSTCHLPQHHSKTYSECQLHNWCLKNGQVEDINRYARHKKWLIRCPDCRVILCLDCYTVFHTVHNLHTIKNRVDDENTDHPRMELSIFFGRYHRKFWHPKLGITKYF